MKDTLHKQLSGFSLIQLAVIMAVASVVMVSVLPGEKKGGEGMTSADPQVKLTLDNMAKIEDATRGFLLRNGRWPCPANGLAYRAQAGVEANNPGSCVGGDIAANFINIERGVVGGVVPCKTLGLAPDICLDGWGKRIGYHITQMATAAESCTTGLKAGTVYVYDKAGSGAKLIASPIALYLSAGQDGIGAFPQLFKPHPKFATDSAGEDDENGGIGLTIAGLAMMMVKVLGDSMSQAVALSVM